MLNLLVIIAGHGQGHKHVDAVTSGHRKHRSGKLRHTILHHYNRDVQLTEAFLGARRDSVRAYGVGRFFRVFDWAHFGQVSMLQVTAWKLFLTSPFLLQHLPRYDLVASPLRQAAFVGHHRCVRTR